MKNHIRALMIALLTGSVVFSGCVQMPTEKQGVIDVRPSIAFKLANKEAAEATVFVDGLRVGVVKNYLENQNAVRVLPGMHEIRVVEGGRVFLEEKVYIGDGVNKIFIVN